MPCRAMAHLEQVYILLLRSEFAYCEGTTRPRLQRGLVLTAVDEIEVCLNGV